MYAIILCGGSGTRLWPLSRKSTPKQFLSLYSKRSLLQETFLRMREIMPAENIFFSTYGKISADKVFDQISRVEKKVKKNQVILEPEKLNTAPAIAAAVRHLQQKTGIDENDPIIVLPSDHYIGNKKEYLRVVKMAMEKVGSNIGTIGIVPTGPEIGYGYIKKGKKEDDYFLADEFKEKPDKSTAKRYIKSRKYIWNSGMYIFNTKTFLEELEKYVPKIYQAITAKSNKEFSVKFKSLDSISIDYAISEKSDKVIIFEGDFEWNDIGSFDSLAEVLAGSQGKNRNVIVGAENVFIHSSSKEKRIAVVGVDDLIVVEDGDAILIARKGQSEDVKKVVDFLKERKK
ncbi:MAG: Mannose-1-phosphate guanylyltransferase / phosphomannose isomerase [Candidatus Moranbacteria bacterium GW2011_GWE2_35_2-]|nr:MAG: Mannose-1-phosphate guanylyltransferase / phosphomannose isomerase [Candidatus Moranbacteria bacterium GW2011_GWE2_35_2-]KKQ06338.1 MAG: Mannose-1-phosphate guanylyltransferase / phosphomannose isomerase [Candidatus Moranbacteria bacterium GW2011_GWF1_36_4]KKQ22221.1 MAG: Mannose-1-phosphate guanylyltransferase / phosphomannose isomerase [Candidatus Moranbacteria bacterium GW2011_GWF2_37_11]KKQ28723.1 MAG: Mannose-1-phosphate guanylyltransferase / phosphomannose isomerase [Candidatus Mor